MNPTKYLEIEPSLRHEYDIEVVPVGETWEETLEALQMVLERYYDEHGWSGNLKLTLRFKTGELPLEDEETL